MLTRLHDLKGFTLGAQDGDIGKTKDAYFDDAAWGLRYLVVDTGKWLPKRKVLIAPAALDGVQLGDRRIAVSLTREQIENSPSIAADQPVSRQHEVDLLQYYGWAPYWGGGFVGAFPAALPTALDADESEDAEDEDHDPHLRSAEEVRGYHLEASDGSLGHVDDFILGTDDWVIRYLVIDTRNWLPGRKVLVAVPWVARVDWHAHRVGCDLGRAQIESGPAYDPGTPISRPYEQRLYAHFGRTGYWE